MSTKPEPRLRFTATGKLTARRRTGRGDIYFPQSVKIGLRHPGMDENTVKWLRVRHKTELMDTETQSHTQRQCQTYRSRLTMCVYELLVLHYFARQFFLSRDSFR